MVPNSIINDKNLSLSCKGFVSYIISKPDNWDFSLNGMASQLKESKPTILKIIDELCKFGYIIKIKTRVNGRQGVSLLELYETPQITPESRILTQKTRVKNTDSENFTTSNTITSNTITSNTITSKKKEEEEEEEEEVIKNSFSDLTSFISMIRLNFSGIDFNIEGNMYFVNNSGFLVSSSSNKKISVGLAKDIYRRLFDKWDIAKPYFYQERAKKLLTKVA
jgi:hypothetical protein